ncbi:MAG: hypothetical protein WD200_00125 [Candidatus Andersenbacteria bacterium]
MKKLIYIFVLAMELVFISGCASGFVPVWPQEPHLLNPVQLEAPE